ncbi:MAG: DUF4440 domain-containing protein [Caldilineaceae bacterium]|nr:DUF4440 domain-containing protein [Caldilineaceae bacterium]
MDESQHTIRLVQHQWQSYFHQGNAAGIAALYTETGQLMPAYSPAIRGRQAIQAFWQGFLDMGIYTMLRESTTLESLTATVNETGAYRFLDRRRRILDVGKYVIIWKATHWQWQIHCEIWTSNLPLR